MREYVLWQSQHTPATLDAMPSGWELPEETSTPAQGGSFVFSSRSTGWSTLKSLYHIKQLSSLGGFIASAYYPGANPTPGWEPYLTDSLLPRSFSLTAIFPSTKENSHAFPRLADWYHWLHPAVEVTGKLDPGLGREGLPAQLFASLCVTLTLLASHPVQCRWVPIPIAKFSLQCMQTFMALETATSVVITIYWK